MLAILPLIWGFIPSKLKVYAVMAIIVLVGGLALWWYISHLQNKAADLEKEVLLNKVEIETQKEQTKAVLNGLNDEIAKSKERQKAVDELRQNYEENSEGIKKLQETFSKHNLEQLSTKKPKLIEKIINKATRKSIEDINTAAEGIK
jgi:uncharacterized protein HemX